MFKNYFKIAFRSILRQKVYAGINVLGLAIGTAACLLILQYVTFELSYENFHTKKDRIYRIEQDEYENGKLVTKGVVGAFAVGNSFKDALPEIEDYVKLVPFSSVVVERNNQPLKINKIFFAGSSFFNVFSYPLLSGDSKTALSEPFTAVISETTALRLFGNENAIGKTINLNKEKNYKITGVFKDLPVNTQLKANILLSYASFLKIDNNSESEKAWLWNGCFTYLLLRKDVNPKSVTSKFPAIVNKLTGADFKKYNMSNTYLLQPIEDIHLYSNFLGEPEPNGDYKTVYILLGIAIFIVVIAWVNYINLATARAINRAKEVGIRKAVGSQRSQLVVQFILESALLNAFALVLALLIVIVTIPLFNQLAGQQLSFSLLGTLNFWLAFSALFIIGTLSSGIYPAFVLSSFKPVEVLKGKMVSTKQGALLRKSLVIFQFSASLFLLIATLIIYRQTQFMRQQSLGINIDQTLIIPRSLVGNDSVFTLQMNAFKEELLRNASIQNITVSSSIPGEEVKWVAGGVKLHGADESTGRQYRVIAVDDDYIKTYGLKLIAGRTFSKDLGIHPHALIFNRKAIEQLGFNKPEEAIGKQIDFWEEEYTIVGVTENYHQQSLQASYEPIILRLNPNVRGYFSIKTNTAELDQTINKIKTEWSKFFPEDTFDYFFLDDHFNAQYKSDQSFNKIFGLFTALAILVACLGLFGLASYTSLQRTKEIGIRKVLGASVGEILQLLYREYASLLLVAFIIAIPLAWYTTNKWLQGYAFRITIHWLYFVLPFLVIVFIALLAVSAQSIKAALANPVKSLRTE
ncbi:MAG: ABC transporter permease [Bacteroidia bacterium]